MRKLLLLMVVLPTLVATETGFSQSGSAGFGIQWVRSNPFTTFAWTIGNTFNISLYDGEYFSNYFDDSSNGSQYATPFIAGSDVSESLTTIDTRLSQSYISINFIDDEPTLSQIPQVASDAAQTRTIRPDLPVLVNALGGSGSSYTQYLNNLVSQVKPDILSFDNYPWQAGNVGYNTTYFSNLMAVRSVSLAADIPFFDWVQSYGGGNQATPSESELRMNAFSSLTVGSKGLGFFSFGVFPPSITQSLIKQDGPYSSPDTLYPVAADINSQVAKIGQALRYLTSTGVGYIDGNAQSTVPSGLSVWTQGRGGDPHLINVSSDNGVSGNSKQDGLLGFFTDDAGQNYFMLTNLYTGPNATSAQTNSTFQLTFDSSVNSILELDSVTGLPDVVSLSNHVLTITLGGGQGELFKYNTGTFAGVSLMPQWEPNASGDWNNATNWNGGAIPNGVDAEADFFAAITTNHTVITDVPVTLGTISFYNSNTYQISGTGSLTLQVSQSSNAQVIVQAGTQEINLPTIIASNTIFNVAAGATLIVADPLTIMPGEKLSTTGAGTVKYESIVSVENGASIVFAGSTHTGQLSLDSAAIASISSSDGGATVDVNGFSNSGTFDVGNNKLIVIYGNGADPIDYIRSQLVQGYADGKWSGMGINSSFAATQAGFGLGYADGADNVVSGLSSGDIEVTYALYGDLNLDGVVDGADLKIFEANFDKSVTGWDQGDFQYDGFVNASDFALLADNFGKSATGAEVTLPSNEWAALYDFATQNGLSADVPEPASLSMVLSATVCFFGKRARRSTIDF
ncbi:MAG TPA: hypothetical protein VG722_10135 [Tepidisphaeraceae bacterium]|nr:hypothetical protein [Tepidisphaeraceae bacterium]